MSLFADENGESSSPRVGRILVVDDDDAVRRSVARALRFEGHVVVAAASGEEALDVLKAAAQAFDIVVSDVMMRGMSGVALCHRVRALYPNTYVILISGYPGSHFSDRSLSIDSFDLIQKPFSPAQLADRVQQALEGHEPR